MTGPPNTMCTNDTLVPGMLLAGSQIVRTPLSVYLLSIDLQSVTQCPFSGCCLQQKIGCQACSAPHDDCGRHTQNALQACLHPDRRRPLLPYLDVTALPLSSRKKSKQPLGSYIAKDAQILRKSCNLRLSARPSRCHLDLPAHSCKSWKKTRG